MTIGWRGRIGVVYIGGALIDRDLWGLVPEGVSVHIARTPVLGEQGPYTPAVALQTAESPAIEAAARTLLPVRPSSVALACTSGSFIGGNGWDREVRDRLSVATALPATTTTTAFLEAFAHLGVRRIAILSPYTTDLTDSFSQYLAAAGFDPVTSVSLELPGAGGYGGIGPATLYDNAKAAARSDTTVDALAIACTGLETLSLIEALEADLGKPVLTANQVTMWSALRVAGIDPSMTDRGRLYAST